MQFCDFDALAKSGAEAELHRLRAEGFLSAAMAEAVRLDEIEKFRESDLFARMRDASYMRREFRFNASLPAWEFTTDPTLAEELRREGADIIVQGVVDCLFIDRDGRAVLVDYKTDRLSDKEMADPALAKKKLLERHRTQLIYYRAVCREMFEREIEECVIYSLPLGRDITVE
jgi:ATP-dependent helicase/nuclease subunit A